MAHAIIQGWDIIATGTAYAVNGADSDQIEVVVSRSPEWDTYRAAARHIVMGLEGTGYSRIETAVQRPRPANVYGSEPIGSVLAELIIHSARSIPVQLLQSACLDAMADWYGSDEAAL